MIVVVGLLNVACWVLLVLIFVRVVFSWIQPADPWRRRDPMANPLYRVSYQVTEPLLAPVRRVLPTGGMGMDFSPMVVSFALFMLMGLLRQL